jgi:pimeloyl-ACP methyl ester carboxylesterase
VRPDLTFATAADGPSIAWTATGSGPTLIHLPGVPFSNIEGEWRIPVLARAFTQLSDHLRLIQFDGRGTGRSQRDVTDLSLEAYLLDLDAVVETAAVEQCVLLGYYHSTALAIAWAARHPERVRGLILFGGTTRLRDTMQGPGTQALLSLIERDWDTFIESMTHAWLGWPAGDEGRLAADWFRTSTTPAVARATLRAASEIDVTSDAARVRCPALVLHRADAPVIPFELSAELARSLPGGRLEVLPGSSASLFFESTERIVDRVVAFVRDPAGSPTAADVR